LLAIKKKVQWEKRSVYEAKRLYRREKIRLRLLLAHDMRPSPFSSSNPRLIVPQKRNAYERSARLAARPRRFCRITGSCADALIALVEQYAGWCGGCGQFFHWKFQSWFGQFSF